MYCCNGAGGGIAGTAVHAVGAKHRTTKRKRILARVFMAQFPARKRVEVPAAVTEEIALALDTPNEMLWPGVSL
jgi:hypothetical protein